MNGFPDLSTMSWLHRGEILLVVAILALLALAPRIDTSRAIPSWIGVLAGLATIVCGVQAAGMERTGLVGVGGALVLAFLLLPAAEMFAQMQRPEAAALLLVGGIGALVLVPSTSLLEMALGTEMISLAGAGLVALGNGERPLEGAFKYFVLTAVTFATLLFGMSLVFLATGKLDVPALGAIAVGARPLAQAGLALFAIGLCFKLAVVPVHFGALDAYTAGPSSFVGFVMVASKLGAAAALARIASGAGDTIGGILVAIGVASLAVAVTASFAQRDLRRLLAYSAVAHAGFLAIGAGSGVVGGPAVMFYVVGYAAAALLGFACLAGTGTNGLPLSSLSPGGNTQLGSLRALGLAVSLMSMAGVPPFPGFWAKLAVLSASWQTWGLGVTTLAALGGVIGIIYYLRPLPDLLAQVREARNAEGDASATLSVLLGLVVVVALGVMPGLAWSLVK